MFVWTQYILTWRELPAHSQSPCWCPDWETQWLPKWQSLSSQSWSCQQLCIEHGTAIRQTKTNKLLKKYIAYRKKKYIEHDSFTKQISLNMILYIAFASRKMIIRLIIIKITTVLLIIPARAQISKICRSIRFILFLFGEKWNGFEIIDLICT